MQKNKFLKLIKNAQSVHDKGKPNGYVTLETDTETLKLVFDFEFEIE